MSIKNKGVVLATNISEHKGVAKDNVGEITIGPLGVKNDAHAGVGYRQVSLLHHSSINAFTRKVGGAFNYGDFGENITFKGIPNANISLLDRLQINDVILEITQIGKKCHGAHCAIFRKVGKCIMPQDGLFTRVIHGGKVAVGDAITHKQYIFKILLITLSDRVLAGIYSDRAGVIAKELLSEFFNDKHWRLEIKQVVIADDEEKLTAHLEGAIKRKVDVVFTLGGTGVGKRDITPGVVSKICDKLLSRIMDYIALKYAANNPAALLSRSVAGVACDTQIYTLPGSVVGVIEYLNEIFKILEHVSYTLKGIDKHG